MKRRYREGTLSGEVFTGEDALSRPMDVDQLNKLNPNPIYGLEDFLTKAEKLAEKMIESGPVRAERGEKLKQDVERIRRKLERGLADLQLIDPNIGGRALQETVFLSVCAGLTYASLRHELHDDQPARGRRKRTTRTAYFAAKKKATSRENLCQLLDIKNEQSLRKWERREGIAHAVWKRKRKPKVTSTPI